MHFVSGVSVHVPCLPMSLRSHNLFRFGVFEGCGPWEVLLTRRWNIPRGHGHRDGVLAILRAFPSAAWPPVSADIVVFRRRACAPQEATR